MEPDRLISQVSPPLDDALARSLIQEFIAIERRYVLGDWEPATLDGGQFAEVAARIVYHIDSHNLNRRKSLDDCLKHVEDETNSNAHAFPQRRAALHLTRVLRTLYKFRSQRGAVHIDPDYTANELDSAFVLSMVRWLMSEILRIFWTGSSQLVAQAIREIVRYEVPAILVIDGKLLVLRTDCTIEEEILLLLHNAGETGLTRTQIGQSIPKSAPAITKAISRLASARNRQILKRKDTTYVLTPNGSRRVLEELSNKLRVQ